MKGLDVLGSVLGTVVKEVIKFFDMCFREGYLLYLIVALVALVVWVYLF